MKVRVSHTVEADSIETENYMIWARENGLFIEHKANAFALGIGENSVGMGIRARRPRHDHSNHIRIIVENVIENSYPDPSMRAGKAEYKPIQIGVRGILEMRP